VGQQISKLDAARRQLDTAIELWVEDRDALSAFTLAFASFKILLNLYPHQAADGFGKMIDTLIAHRIGWKAFSRHVNFLKHADKDPEAVLVDFHPDMAITVIGLATFLHRRLNNGVLTLQMKAFDSWIEMAAADDLGIEAVDQNPERAAENRRIRAALKVAPRERYMEQARAYYRFFVENHDRLEGEVTNALAGGETFQQILDRSMPVAAKRIAPDETP
jgi:hypothetical protein